MAGVLNVDQIANSAGTGPVSFPFGATGIDIQLGYTTTATAAGTTIDVKFYAASIFHRGYDANRSFTCYFRFNTWPAVSGG